MSYRRRKSQRRQLMGDDLPAVYTVPGCDSILHQLELHRRMIDHTMGLLLWPGVPVMRCGCWVGLVRDGIPDGVRAAAPEPNS